MDLFKFLIKHSEVIRAFVFVFAFNTEFRENIA